MANKVAYLGLTQDVGKREAAQKELGVLSELVSFKQQQEALEQQANADQDAYYQQLREQADMLLPGDREMVNEKVRQLQADIKAKVRSFGGSMKAFRNNGGARLTSDYTNQILDSNELQIFRQNRINMERILDAKAKGMGHLIAPQDLLALERYEQNGKGEITYSGLMNEIELPPADQFRRDRIITPAQVLRHGSNRSKIIANFLTERPNYQGELTQEVLEAYVLSKGWTQQGTYVDPYRNYGYGKGSGSGSSNEDQGPAKVTLGGSIIDITNNSWQLPISEINEDSFKNDAYVDVVAGSNFESKWELAVDNNNVPWVDEDTKWRLKGARKFNNNLNMPLLNTVMGDEGLTPDKNGEINLNFEKLIGKLYNSDGGLAEPWKNNRKVKVIGSGIGWETIIDGKSSLVMEPVNSLGEVEELEQDPYYTEEGAEEAKGHPVAFVAIKNERWGMSDNVFYVKVPLTGQQNQAAFQKQMELTGMNDITAMQQEDQDRSKAYTKAEALAQATTAVENTDTNNPAFETDIFRLQNGAYNIQSGGRRRENLRRAWYLTMDYLAKLNGSNFDLNKAIEMDLFSKMMQQQNLIGALKGTRYNDAQIIQQLSSNLNAGMAPGQKDPITEMMMMFLRKMNNPQ